MFSERVVDSNGNHVQTPSGGGDRTDTLDRKPVVKVVSGSQTHYNILNSQGVRSRWTVTTASVPVNTTFGQAGVAEYSGNITVVQSISLPDGSSYNFGYDSLFGDLTAMTLRTGGTVNYTYATFADAYGTKNRWVDSRTSAGGTWSYLPEVLSVCSFGAVGCQQKVTVTKPSGDQAVHSFTLNSGAWETQEQRYTGPASSGTLLETTSTDYDFTNACVQTGCFGAAYIRPTRSTVSLPSVNGTLSSKAEFAYDTAQRGNVTSKKEWNYTLGSFGASPDRETQTTYVTTSGYTSRNFISLPSSIVAKNGSGTQVAKTDYTYDATPLTNVSSITHHDSSIFNTSYTYRGNVTTASKWVSGTTYLNTTYNYDITGQLLSETNPWNYARSYSYADQFYRDNGSNPGSAYTPPAPTNAYLTQVTLVNLPNSDKQFFTYYFDSGKLATDGDTNLAKIYFHYLDPLDRETHRYERALASGSKGWQLTQYVSATETATYTGITSTTAASSCTGCKQERSYLDTWGRPIQQKLVSDPEGAVFSDTIYDSGGRASTASNPYRTTGEATYGLSANQYDGLDRITRVTHPDSNFVQTVYGAAVSSAGGRSSQLCSGAAGYPALKIDEAGKKLQSWTDAFGETIETDEPDSSNNLTLATCYQYDALDNLTQVTQGAQTRSYTYDGLSRKTSETLPESGTTNYLYTAASGNVCTGSGAELCRVTDARGITHHLHLQLHRPADLDLLFRRHARGQLQLRRHQLQRTDHQLRRRTEDGDE